MAVFSKPLTLSNSCYEIGHTWTPYCTTAAGDVAKACYYQAFKIYASLYVIAALLRRKKLQYWKKKLIYEVLQSTLFLGSNGFLFISFFCVWRRVIGTLYMFNSGYLPALWASYLAILLERKSRRGILAVYISNVALETVYRMLVSRGLFQPIKHGEVWVFSAISAVYLYLFRKPGGLSDSPLSVLKFFLGTSELPASSQHNDQGETTPSVTKPVHSFKVPKVAEWAICRLRQAPKHRLCKHNLSCAHYILKGLVQTFGLGYIIQGGLKILTSLTRVFRKPTLLWQAVTHKDNFYLGAFLGSFSAIFRAVSCLLRWVRDKDEELHGLIAGFLSGVSMMWYKSFTIPLYMGSKLVEVLYFKGIKSNILPYIKCADIIIYSISTAFVFHAAVFEPHNLRPAYWKFLLRLTENKFGTMNRILLDAYGTRASKLMPDWWPDYDKRFSSLEKPIQRLSS